MRRQPRLELIASLWWLLVGAGVVEAVGGVAAAVHDASRGRHGPVLRDPAAIASSGDALYVYTDWRRIRVFGLDGAERASWPVATGEGAVKLAFDPAGVLHVATLRTDTHYEFDGTGRLLGEVVDAEAFQRLPIESFVRSGGPDGTRYEIEGRALVAVSPGGRRSVVVPGPPRALSPFFFGALTPLVFAGHGGLTALLGVALAVYSRRRHPSR